ADIAWKYRRNLGASAKQERRLERANEILRLLEPNPHRTCASCGKLYEINRDWRDRTGARSREHKPFFLRRTANPRRSPLFAHSRSTLLLRSLHEPRTPGMAGY